jgi:hypothetical protein
MDQVQNAIAAATAKLRREFQVTNLLFRGSSVMKSVSNTIKSALNPTLPSKIPYSKERVETELIKHSPSREVKYEYN